MSEAVWKVPEVSFREAFFVWLKIGLLSFGGPAGQIALMHQILVDEKKWVNEKQFLHALNYCMLLPGPEAMQLSVYIGWLLHRMPGGFMAGTLFVLPGFLVIMAFSMLYVLYQQLFIVEGLFLGIKAAVLVIVLQAGIKIWKRVIKNRFMALIAGLAFSGVFFFKISFPLIILSAALIGFIYSFWRLKDNKEKIPVAVKLTKVPEKTQFFKVLFIGLMIWSFPVLAIGFLFGFEHVLVTEGVFFSKMAVVTFGGAYAVLAYVAEAAVENYNWLMPGEMLDGLGLAETTPGPLILVVQFVGFLGAFRNPGLLDPMLAGILGALMTAWVTFVPCFLWIFLGAPHIEKLAENRRLSEGLSIILSAVVGVVFNLVVWFSLHVLFLEMNEIGWGVMTFLVPNLASIHYMTLFMISLAFVLMFRFKMGMIKTLFLCAILGIFYQGFQVY